MPTYRLAHGSIYFGAARRHCALYGTAVDLGPEELRPLAGARGTLRFPLDRPVPAEAVRRLIAVTAQVKEGDA